MVESWSYAEVDPMGDRILVTGASGRAGAEMVKSLRAAGARVRAAIHYPDHEAESRATAVEYVEVDFDHPETLETAFRGVDKAVLITPEEATMVQMTANLVDAAERAGVGSLLRVSFIHADAGIGGRLLRWHREAEELVAASPIPSACLRPNSYMQNFVTMYAPSIFTRGAFFTPMGQGRISYVDGRDVAEAAAEILLGSGHEGRTYSLTGPEPLSHGEIAEILSRETGQSIRYVDVGEEDACMALERRGASPELVEALCELWLAMRHDEFAPTSDGFELVTAHAPTRFADFVREHRAELVVSPAARR
jgi:uncharacterized protein YbjT (DUF2867 family)